MTKTSAGGMEEIRQYLIDLIEVSGRSASAIAESAGLSKSGVLRFLKGSPQSLGEPGVAKMLSALHVAGVRLSRSVVHFFAVKDPDPLIRIMKKEGMKWEMVYVSPEKNSPKDFLTLGIMDPLLLFNPSLRIVIRQPSALATPVKSPLLEAGLAEWLPVPPDPDFDNPRLRISREKYDKIIDGMTSCEEFDEIVSQKSGKEEEGWEEVFRKIREFGMAPSEVLEILKKKSKK